MDDSPRIVDPFDRALGQLDGLPDVVHTKQSTVQTTVPLVGNAETWILQMFRQKDQGDTLFLQRIGPGGSLRLVIPPKVADVIARQRESLTDKSRSKAARTLAASRSDEDRAKAAARLHRPEVRARARRTRKRKAAARAAKKGGAA